MTRLTRKTVAELTPEQRDLFDEIIANRPVRPQNGHIGGPFDMWLRTPEMGRLLVNLAGYFRFKSSVDRRYIELTILVTGAFWKAQFECSPMNPWLEKPGFPMTSFMLSRLVKCLTSQMKATGFPGASQMSFTRVTNSVRKLM